MKFENELKTTTQNAFTLLTSPKGFGSDYALAKYIVKKGYSMQAIQISSFRKGKRRCSASTGKIIKKLFDIEITDAYGAQGRALKDLVK